MTESTLGQRIAAKRNELGLSQNALGEQLGVSRQSVFKWESDAAIPEIDKLIALSRLFGVSIDWLLGIRTVPKAEDAEKKAAEPPQDFTARERQILEMLSGQKTTEPRWKKYLTAGMAVCTVAAMILSGLSFYKWNQASKALEAAQAQVEKYSAYIQSLISDGMVVVKSFDYDCIPDANMVKAHVRMNITPYAYQEGQSAALVVLLGGEVRAIHACQWTGAVWATEFDLDAVDGFEFLFKLTDDMGMEMNQGLHAPLLSQMGLNLSWPTNQSVTWKSLDRQANALVFTDMHVQIPLPGVFRYTENLWESCELVLTTETGTVLGSYDLMNRSGYSAQIDFDESDVDFTTRAVNLLFPNQPVGTKLHLFLNGTLSTGHTFSCPVDCWKVDENGIPSDFSEPRA